MYCTHASPLALASRMPARSHRLVLQPNTTSEPATALVAATTAAAAAVSSSAAALSPRRSCTTVDTPSRSA
eukprot:3844463-Prymnesium_polylepis.1